MSKKDAPAGMCILSAPKNSGGFTHDGQFYPVKDGAIMVPSAAVEAAKSHGFTDEE
jgi:hypothetical protein